MAPTLKLLSLDSPSGCRKVWLFLGKASDHWPPITKSMFCEKATADKQNSVISFPVVSFSLGNPIYILRVCSVPFGLFMFCSSVRVITMTW